MLRTTLGRLLLATGAALALPQITMDTPWQAGIVLGVVLAVTGWTLIDPPAGTEDSGER